MMPKSIRWRMTLWYASAMAIILLFHSGCVYVLIRSHLSVELDRRLQRNLDLAAQLVELKSNEETRGLSSGELKIWDREGGEEWRAFFSRVDFLDVTSSDGAFSCHFPGINTSQQQPMRYKTLSRKYGERDVTVRIGISESQMDEFLASLLLFKELGMPLFLLLSVFGGWWLAGRTLSPIALMTNQAKRISAESLSERLPVAEPQDELGQLAMVFNDTFSRLEHSFDQLRRFAIDASHELRTPLTAIRATGEVALREPRSDSEYRETIGSMLEEVESLTQLVENLLLLSRSDKKIINANLQPTDAAALVRNVIEMIGVLAEEKNQHFQIDAPFPVPILADSALLRQAFGNLLDNAIKYSPTGSEIRVAVTSRGDQAIIEISDSGPGIPVEHQPHLFERLYRVDKSRSREMGGYGLGLAITRWIVEAHHGRVELESAEGKGSTFRVVLESDVAQRAS